MLLRTLLLVLVLAPLPVLAANPGPAVAPNSVGPWSWAGCKKTIETSMVIRCAALTMKIGRVPSEKPPTDAQLLQTEREALMTSSASLTTKFPSVKGVVSAVTLDLGGAKKVPHSVLSFPETKETNAVAFHALAIPATVDGKHFVTLYTCSAKVDAECTAALVDVVTKGPPKI
jgi:hypothetical protein